MTRYPQRTSQNTDGQEQVIYDHWLDCVRNESPAQVIQRFHDLFILGHHYSSHTIRNTLEQILMRSTSTEELMPFFNRCCYILINYWQMSPTDKWAIVDLVDALHQVQGPGATRRYDRAAKRLRALVFQYTKSHYCTQLRRIAEFVREKSQLSLRAPLMSLIDRYPYLYTHCLKSTHEDSSRVRLIRQAKTQAQQKFEADLSRFIALSAVRQGRSPMPNEADLKNPTLLTTQDLHGSLKHFVGKSTCQGTYREMSGNFVRTVDQQLRFQDFKDNLYDYLTADIDPKYANRRFNTNLRNHLNAISPEYHRKPVSDILTTRTYNRTLNYLVIESRQSPKHIVFMDLISNIGTTRTIGLLLKLVLLKHSVKDSLERRLGVLFQHYESHQHSGIQWLVRCLEKVNLAFTTHFGKLNVSYLSAL